MAKTRIKTTPTRMQKEALMASEVVSTTTNIVAEHVFKKRISVLKNSLAAKEKPLPITSTIIVQPPKRTNSISSTTSTLSHTSDGTHSCTDSPPPSHIAEAGAQNNGPTMDELTASAIKTLNAGFLAKSNARLLKNRKVYMITEKCDDTASAANIGENGNGSDNGMTTGQKRKMFLIMEEDEGDKNNEKQMKVESFGPKKLTLYTNTSDGQLPQEFEKVLPEILNRIQANKGVKKIVEAFKGSSEVVEAVEPKSAAQMSLLKPLSNSKLQMKTETPERLPLTLPPKKNRTKIITTQIVPVNSSPPLSAYPANGVENWTETTSPVAASGAAAPCLVTANISNGFYKTEKSCGATPVIVKASTLVTTNGNGSTPANGLKSKENCNSISNKTTVNQLHKNINLSTDFLFLMKMLPKLESIEEPHKSNVKTYIEDIINQYAPHQIEQQ